MSTFLLHVLGIDNMSGRWYGFWSGFGSDIGQVTIVAGIISFIRRSARQHRESIAQSARHQTERLAQSAEHHKVHLELLRRHHQQLLDAQPEVVTVTAAAPDRPAAERVAPAPARPAAKRGGRT